MIKSVVIGNLDGVHLGHQNLLHQCSGDVAAVTFSPHPSRYFQRQTIHQTTLMPDDVKSAFLRKNGATHVQNYLFNATVADMSPEDFIRSLIDHFPKVNELTIGQNFRFGKSRSGDVGVMNTLATAFGLSVKVADLMEIDGDIVSSTRVRQALLAGDLNVAHALLSRPYMLFGTVIHGNKNGRKLGFPTANIQTDQLLPKPGVYAGYLCSVGLTYSETSAETKMPAVLNIGTRPTFKSGSQHLVAESHVLDQNLGNTLYGTRVCFEFHSRLRSERQFSSLDELKRHIYEDVNKARSLL